MCGTNNLALNDFCNTKQTLQGERIGSGQHKSFQLWCLSLHSFPFELGSEIKEIDVLAGSIRAHAVWS